MKNRVRLGPRLAACAAYCREKARMADIGTDHALLPIYLIQSGKVLSAAASDINPEPLARAAENIARHSVSCEGLSDKITLTLCGGLGGIDPSAVDDIVIAGMGGELIADILSEAPWLSDKRYRLILQPMSKYARLRGWLFENGFAILDETPVIDNGRCYSVMLCGYTGEKRSQVGLMELYCGRVTECEGEAARRYLEMIKCRFEDMKSGADISGNDKLSSELSSCISYITEKINEK